MKGFCTDRLVILIFSFIPHSGCETIWWTCQDGPRSPFPCTPKKEDLQKRDRSCVVSPGLRVQILAPPGGSSGVFENSQAGGTLFRMFWLDFPLESAAKFGVFLSTPGCLNINSNLSLQTHPSEAPHFETPRLARWWHNKDDLNPGVMYPSKNPWV